MTSRIRELLEQAFAGAEQRPALVDQYLGQAADVGAADEARLAPLLELALEHYQACRAASLRQSAERLQSEAQTENLLQLLGTILESSDQGIMALDMDDRIIRFNSQFISLFQIPDEVMAFWCHDEVMAAVLANLVEPAAFLASLAELCAQPAAVWRETLECQDGRVIEWRSLPQPAVWAGVKRVVSFLDVSERFRSETNRRLLERKLDEAQGRLLQAEKLSAIFQLSAGLAHEISNPVGFINSNLEILGGYVRGMLDLLQRYADVERSLPADLPWRREIAAAKEQLDFEFLQADALDLLNESLHGTRRLATMVGSLRVLAHAQGSATSLVDVHGLLDSALAAASPAAGADVKFLPVFAALPPLECRPSELVEVFKSLLANAIEALAGSGSVGIRTGLDAGLVWVDIADTGRGIPPENLGRIFEPFFTTKPPGAGMGLGLSVAYAIVAMHGGSITVSSQPGKGSRFRVALPLRQPGSTID